MLKNESLNFMTYEVIYQHVKRVHPSLCWQYATLNGIWHQ